jgi:protein TonB
MPAKTNIDRRERLLALAAVVLVQGVLGLALLLGLRVGAIRHSELVSRLIDVTVTPPPPPPPPIAEPVRPAKRADSAPRSQPAPKGGLPGPARAAPLPALKPIVAIRPSAPPSGGGSGTGSATGAGAGGGLGGDGSGDGDGGGTDLEQIAGGIGPSDYPRDLREQGIGGRVGMVFTVGPSGRVTSCRVTHSSGVSELDSLTCRLIQQRFLYRPSTDRYGRPIADEVEGEHDWIPRR